MGALLERIEQLRSVLAAEGLFAAERKRPLPFLPRSVGLVTGRASAAERDVVENARRRWPAVEVRVEPVAVQGPYAVTEIVAALQRLDADPQVDVIVLARGGGSMEDLLPFSDESLVRAVVASRTPVVSRDRPRDRRPARGPRRRSSAPRRRQTPASWSSRTWPRRAHGSAMLPTAPAGTSRGAIEAEQHRLDALRSRPALADPLGVLAGWGYGDRGDA